MITLLTGIYLASVLALALYGALGFLTFWLYRRHRSREYPLPEIADDSLPRVTVQLPVYNEVAVVERLIRSAAALDYPRDRLQILVLDDSTDLTTAKAAALADEYRARGVDVTLIHRDNRQGYKAGALTAAMPYTTGDFIAIFDADFQPLPHFLRATVPYFVANTKLGMVQTRWGHLNDGDSTLTGAQAIALDKHFGMEQFVRHRANLYPKFNGSAGIWRRDCLDAAGGWEADTVCEDLCLSTRAVLQGWEFLFLPDVVAPAELPANILDYKNQQARWAEGSSQCLRKYGSDILRDRGHTLFARLYALLSMSAYMTHGLLILLLLLQIPLILSGYSPPGWLLVATIAGMGQPLLFIAAQQTLHRDWAARLRHLPSLLLVAVGMAPSNTRAILRGILGREHPFVRTPKGHVPSYRLPLDGIWLVELALFAYAALGLALALHFGATGALVMLLTCCLGFAYVLALEAREVWTNRRPARKPAEL